MTAVIAIDGPAGSGKSTIARELAKRLKWEYLNTGLTYRALAFLSLSRKIPLVEPEALLLLDAWPVQIQGSAVHIEGQPVDVNFYDPVVDEAASILATYPRVRQRLVLLQRNMAEGKNVVAEGRDTTTVVFPDALLKIYLDAEPHVRAWRRYKDLSSWIPDIRFHEVFRWILVRDYRDTHRECTPLQKVASVLKVDTTRKPIEEVLSLIEGELKTRLG